MSRQTAKRVTFESFVIIVSVFVALMAETWWSETQDRESAGQHLVSLERDLAQMQASADTAVVSTTRAAQAGQRLLAALSGPEPAAIADSAITLMAHLHSLPVFSPSLGAYEALLASGHFELVGSAELRRGLVETYGSFPMVRAREEEARGAAQALTGSRPFLDMVGFDRMLGAYGVGRGAVGAPPSEVRQWAESRELKSHIGLLYGQLVASLLEYRSLSDRVTTVQHQLAAEVGR
jgi:hypothetical protein